MTIEKKSLISTLQSAKKANVAKESASADVSKSSGIKSPSQRALALKATGKMRHALARKTAKK